MLSKIFFAAAGSSFKSTWEIVNKPSVACILKTCALFVFQVYKRNYHFLERNTSVLQRVPVMIYKLVVIVWVNKKLILLCKGEFIIYKLRGKHAFCRVVYHKNIFRNNGKRPHGHAYRVGVRSRTAINS